MSMETMDMETSSDPFGFHSLLPNNNISLRHVVARCSQNHAESFIDMESSFGYNALQLLDPNSDLSKQHPQVSQVFRARLKAVFDQRGKQDFSLCTCKQDIGHAGHGETFQKNFQTDYGAISNLEFNKRVTSRICALCPDLQNRIDIYGLIGEGTFGMALLAREQAGDGAVPFEDLEQYAIKAQAHKTVLSEMKMRLLRPEMVLFEEPTGKRHYIPEEALVLIYLNGSDRFPTIDSIYTHGMQWVLLMQAYVDPSPEARAPIYEYDFLQVNEREGTITYVLPDFPSFAGHYLMNRPYGPTVNELHGCKVAGQFLQGMVQLADMGIYHADISTYNYLLDQDLNVQLIDFGQIYFSLTDEGFKADRASMIPFQEYQMRPELAVEYMKYDQAWEAQAPNQVPQVDVLVPTRVFMPSDNRQTALWKYSTIVYGLLHGYWPWEKRESGDLDWCKQYRGTFTDPCYPIIKNRRKRMINEDITVDESLTQDCRDMLQAALSRDPRDRPSLQEMSTFPWFSRWSATEAAVGRPMKRPRITRYERAQRGPRRVKVN